MTTLPDQIIGTSRVVKFAFTRDDDDQSDWSDADVVGVVASIGAGDVRAHLATYSEGSGVAYSSSAESGRSGQVTIAASLFSSLSAGARVCIEIKATTSSNKTFSGQGFWKLLKANPTS